MIQQTTFDDGNWKWHYGCQYISPTNDPKDWCYTIGFDTKDGGYLNNEAISCYYWQTEKLLQISKGGNRLDFYVENFHDIEVILKPLIKANKANPYPIYESISKTRKDKINNINKNNK
jgi:hypothetical protein